MEVLGLILFVSVALNVIQFQWNRALKKKLVKNDEENSDLAKLLQTARNNPSALESSGFLGY